MSGLTRYIHALRLFDDRRGDWTIGDMATALSLPSSTVYRTVRDMVADGLLEAANEGHYRLGCCFVEFDRVVRKTDPLYEAGACLLEEIVAQARVPCVAVLARLYNDKIMCVADAASEDVTFRTSLERGRPRPLTLGATSKVILAQLPSRKLSRLLDTQPAGGPGHALRSSDAYRAELASIRRRGFSITRGEVDKNLVGIAAAVSDPARGLLGSLSLVIQATADAAIERRLAMLVVSTAGLLAEQLASTADGKSDIASVGQAAS